MWRLAHGSKVVTLEKNDVTDVINKTTSLECVEGGGGAEALPQMQKSYTQAHHVEDEIPHQRKKNTHTDL